MGRIEHTREMLERMPEGARLLGREEDHSIERERERERERDPQLSHPGFSSV
jgi:hypothetical protein